MRKIKETTAVKLVFEALVRADDFRTAKQLQAETGQPANRVSAALYNLLKYHAVSFVESDRQLWWFATPADDTRVKTVDERTPESRPRKARKGKKGGAL